jgi:hypothetical protein
MQKLPCAEAFDRPSVAASSAQLVHMHTFLQMHSHLALGGLGRMGIWISKIDGTNIPGGTNTRP